MPKFGSSEMSLCDRNLCVELVLTGYNYLLVYKDSFFDKDKLRSTQQYALVLHIFLSLSSFCCFFLLPRHENGIA